MLLFFFNGLLLLLVSNLTYTNNDLKSLISSFIPFREDGKIFIPSHIKHVKLDIGLSFCAPISQQWLTHENDLMVFGFEPNPASVQSILNGSAIGSHHMALEKRFIQKSFFVIPCALGSSSDKMIKFFVTKNDCGCSSLYKPKDFEVEHIITVPIFSLANFFELFPFDTHPVIDYIKIDAQGSDLDIAKSAGDYLRERVIYITLEAEDQQYLNTKNSLAEITKHMESIGFVPHNTSATQDPTYFNPRFAEYIKQNSIIIYQKG
jgi:FkbM family methyltransferase